MMGMKTKAQPEGAPAAPSTRSPWRSRSIAASFARSYAGDRDHLALMMKEAINHKGFALLDILQPCVTFNQVNTYQWFADRVYHLDASYDPTNRAAAFAKALEPPDKIPWA